MDWTGCDLVEVVPANVSGVPILRHSRVQAEIVIESYELGESVEEIAFSFEPPIESVRGVIDFAFHTSPLKTA